VVKPPAISDNRDRNELFFIIQLLSYSLIYKRTGVRFPYWTMGDPIDETVVLNRALINK